MKRCLEQSASTSEKKACTGEAIPDGDCRGNTSLDEAAPEKEEEEGASQIPVLLCLTDGHFSNRSNCTMFMICHDNVLLQKVLRAKDAIKKEESKNIRGLFTGKGFLMGSKLNAFTKKTQCIT